MAKLLDLFVRAVGFVPRARALLVARARARLLGHARRSAATSQSAATVLFVPVTAQGWAERAAANRLLCEGSASRWPDGAVRIAVDRNPFRSAQAAISL